MFRYFIVNKPFDVLTGFTSDKGVRNLHELGDFPKDVYPIGRLDKDSEGLLIISNDKKLQNILTDPKFNHQKEYFVQVDGDINEIAINQLVSGVEIKIKGKTHVTKKAIAKKVSTPNWIWERTPPIRVRKAIPTSWISLSITEGKNRQVRRMTAAVNFPTLRLVRYRIANLNLSFIQNQKMKEIQQKELYQLLGIKPNY